jgi:hypothetical protein
MGENKDEGIDVKKILDELQEKLHEKGYREYTVIELWHSGTLETIAKQYGFTVPDELPEPDVNPYKKATSLFKMALLPFMVQS